jgi:hypothetical protein
MSDEKTQLEFDGIRLSVPVGEDNHPESEPEIEITPDASSPESEPLEELDICLRPPLEDMDTAETETVPVTEEPAKPIEIAPKAESIPAAAPVHNIPVETPPVPVKKAPVRAVLREPEVGCSGGKRGSKKGCLLFLFIILLISGSAGFAWWKYRAWCVEKIEQLKNLAGLTENESASAAGENGETSSASPSATAPAVTGSGEDIPTTATDGSSASPSATSPALPPATGNLFEAVKQGDKALAVRLISEGADITATDADGNNVLHHAAAVGNVELMVELLRRWSDGINARNNDGNTPLHLAALGNHIGVIRVLRSKRARSLRNNAGKKPGDLAADEDVQLILRNW